MATAITGKRGRVMINGSVFICEKWSVKSSATKVPANDFETGYRKSKAGLVGAEVTISGYWDEDDNPHQNHGIIAGAELSNVLGYLVKGGLVFTFANFTVFDVETSDEVDGRVDLTWSGETQGQFTYPGGVAA